MVLRLNPASRIATLTCAVLTAAALTGTGTGTGTGTARAGTWDCQGGYGPTFGYARCGSGTGTSFRVGAKCLMPGNVHYWKWTGWHATGSGTKYSYCNSGHVAKGWNYEVLLW